MTAAEFIATWKDNPLTERAGAQSHFNDLCDLLGVPKPRDPENYCFERGAKKVGGGDGWADVWMRNHFGWENKKPGGDLRKALKQLTDYAPNLEHPPLLVVSDRERIVIHTAFTGYPDEPREIRIEDLTDPPSRQILTWLFTDPEKLRPEKSSATITEEAAANFSAISEAMRARGLDKQRVAHVLMQCLFAMFAEDEGLLPPELFTNLLASSRHDPHKAAQRLNQLFTLMQQQPGGNYGDHDIAWFNGGLFKRIDIPPLTTDDLDALHQAALRDWRAIDPTIFGTLFERGLDADERAPLGAHYTDTATIEKVIQPLISAPLAAEWASVHAEIAALMAQAGKTKSKSAATTARKAAMVPLQAFLQRLREFRVLDPACGSGNFLYLSLKALRDIEKRALVDAIALGLPESLGLATGPHNILGLELNAFAAELARVTVWIGDIQWCHRNGYQHAINPILQPLDGIKRRDAILAEDGSEPKWPKADVIVGNPPFLGDKKMIGAMGEEYVTRLRKLYRGRVPGGADLVCYWFEKARAQIAAGKAHAAGLVATNSIRGGASRKVLERIVAAQSPSPRRGETPVVALSLFNAWSDEPWINNGAAVRVSLVCFGIVSPRPEGEGAGERVMLNGQPVAGIYADLTAAVETETADVTQARTLLENAGVSFIGTQKTGAFDIAGELARQWLSSPNPHGRPNTDVVRPWANGMDLTRRPSDTWIIDFGTACIEADASFYEQPFGHLQKYVQVARDNKRETVAAKWWLHTRPRPEMRRALVDLNRYIATPRVAKHRFFIWLPITTLPDSRLCVIARASDVMFGILSSRIHECWSLATCSWHGDGSEGGRPTYNAKSCFETFPFPVGLTPADTNGPTATLDSGAVIPTVAPEQRAHAEAIAEAAHRLNHLRENWLNPPEWIERVPEVVPGYPDRIIPKPAHAAELKKRTLTNLYNTPPAWLTNAHRTLDTAVARAYGWSDDPATLTDADIISRLLALNRER